MATNTVETPAKNGVEQEQGTIVVSVDGAAAQNNLRNIRLILGREYKNRVKARSFIITTVILLVIVFLLVNLIIDISYAFLDPRIRY